MDELFDGIKTTSVRAMFVGQRIDTRAFEQIHAISDSPLTVQAGNKGIAILFRYGVVAFMAMTPSEMIAFLSDIKHLITEPIEEPEFDDVKLQIQKQGSEGIHLDTITLNALNLPRLQVIASILAKSVVLGHYEVYLAKHFDRLDPITTRLTAGRGITRGCQLLQHIGEALTIESKMVGRVEISEKPELVWEQPEYERLYLKLEDEFELQERQQAIERKLRLSSHTAQTMLDILQTQRALRVEWYITILIVLEILITLFEKLGS